MTLLLSLGLVRGMLAGLLGAGAATGITMAVRRAIGLPAWHADPVVAIAALSGVLAYFIGLGALTYWLKWAIGADGQEHTPDHNHNHRQGYHWTRFFNFDGNHKIIGIQYGVTAIVVLIVAGIASLVMRLELSQPGQTIIGLGTYNRVMSFHGIAMIAFVLLINAAFINYLAPMMIGAKDMAFPRLNALSFWFVPPAVLLLLASVFAGGAGSGWTAYPPLSSKAPLGQSLMFLAVYLVGFSSILGAINFLTTVVRMRAPGMSWFRLPIFVWTAIASSVLALGVTQFIAMSFLMVLLQRLLGMGFFDPTKGGSAILYEHLFWFYSHPAVYIMIFPWWGVVSEIIPVMARKPLFAYRWVVRIAILGVLLLSPVVWVHHMYPAGVGRSLVVPQMFTTELISVPTGFFFLAWLGTMWLGKMTFPTPMLFAVTFAGVFLIGGLTGIPNAEVPTDLYLHDTYWVVAHFHFTLGAIAFGMMAGLYYWFPKVTGRRYNERLGQIHWGLMTLGFLATMLPLFWAGLMGMRRRVGDYDASLGVTNAHLASTVGAFLVALSMVVFLYNVVQSVRAGARAPANPWHCHTLEWQVASPPPEHTFEKPPTVVGTPYPYGVPGAVHAIAAVSGGSGHAPDG